MFLCEGGESEPIGLKSFSADQPSANTGKGKIGPVAAMSTGIIFSHKKVAMMFLRDWWK